MAMTKTRYRWLALGAFLCLVATVTMCKWQDNTVSAQEQEKKEGDGREKKDVEKPAPLLATADSKPAKETYSPDLCPRSPRFAIRLRIPSALPAFLFSPAHG